MACSSGLCKPRSGFAERTEPKNSAKRAQHCSGVVAVQGASNESSQTIVRINALTLGQQLEGLPIRSGQHRFSSGWHEMIFTHFPKFNGLKMSKCAR